MIDTTFVLHEQYVCQSDITVGYALIVDELHRLDQRDNIVGNIGYIERSGLNIFEDSCKIG